MVGKFHKNTLSVLYTFVLHVGSSTVMNIEGRIILDICNIWLVSSVIKNVDTF